MIKKFISMMLFPIFTCVILSGCGLFMKKDSPVPANNTNVPDNRYHIRFSYYQDGFEDRIGELIAGYNSSNDDSISVETIKIPRDRYDETLNMMITSGESPDVFEIGSQWLYTYISKALLMDVKEYLDKDFCSRMPQWAFDEANEITGGNDVYALPVNQVTVRLIYNKDIFKNAGLNPEAPPKTLDEMKSYAKRISNAGIGLKQYGFALQAGDERSFYEQLMECANTSSGAYYFDFGKKKYDLSVYDEWFKTIIDMKNEESLFPGESSLKSYTALEQFSEGHIGMMYATGIVASILENQLPVSFEWGVAMPPVVKPGAGGIQKITPSTYFAVSSKSAQKNEAVKLWRYLFSDEFVGELYKNGDIIPVMNGITDNTLYKTEITNFSSFFPSAGEAVYPTEPMMVNDWERFDVYASILKSETFSDKLLKEVSERLNIDYENIYINK